MSETPIPVDYEKYWDAIWRFRWSACRVADYREMTDQQKGNMLDQGIPVFAELLTVLGKHKIFIVSSVDTLDKYPEGIRDPLNGHVNIPRAFLHPSDPGVRGTTLLELNDGETYHVQNAFYLRYAVYSGSFFLSTNTCAWTPVTAKRRVNSVEAAIRNSDRLESCLTEIAEIEGMKCEQEFIHDDNYYELKEEACPYRSGFRLYLPSEVLREKLSDDDLKKAQPFVWEDRPLGENHDFGTWRHEGNMMYLDKD